MQTQEVAPTLFLFDIGDFVDHQNGGWPAVVTGRTRITRADGEEGPELYEVCLLLDRLFGEYRHILGEVLVPAA